MTKDTTTINIGLIEWYNDDIGQYEEKGLPRKMPDLIVPFRCDEVEDDNIGSYLMGYLSGKYGIDPVLISWEVAL